MLRFLARNRMLNLRYARLLWRFSWRRWLTRAGHRWRTDGMLFLGRGLEIKIEPRGRDPLRPLRLGRRRLQAPLPRGRGRDRVEDGDGPGVHDLRLPAGADRRAVRDRRPGDVHRLRPRGGGGRAADPAAGHLQARRRRRLQRLDRVRRLHPARGQRRRQLDRRHQRGGDQGRARQRGRRRRPRPRDPHARGAARSCAGPTRSSPIRALRPPCRRRGELRPRARGDPRAPGRGLTGEARPSLRPVVGGSTSGWRVRERAPTSGAQAAQRLTRPSPTDRALRGTKAPQPPQSPRPPNPVVPFVPYGPKGTTTPEARPRSRSRGSLRTPSVHKEPRDDALVPRELPERRRGLVPRELLERREPWSLGELPRDRERRDLGSSGPGLARRRLLGLRSSGPIPLGGVG